MSGAEEEADPKLAGPLKQGAFCIQLAVMPLLAGTVSLPTPPGCPVPGGRTSISKMLTETKPPNSPPPNFMLTAITAKWGKCLYYTEAAQRG